jgi:predicted nucleic acid-binding protein
MIALDTNVLARLVTRDDPQQARAAAALIDEDAACFVPLTVARRRVSLHSAGIR